VAGSEAIFLAKDVIANEVKQSRRIATLYL
jgi:hypothetical protein